MRSVWHWELRTVQRGPTVSHGGCFKVSKHFCVQKNLRKDLIQDRLTLVQHKKQGFLYTSLFIPVLIQSMSWWPPLFLLFLPLMYFHWSYLFLPSVGDRELFCSFLVIAFLIFFYYGEVTSFQQARREEKRSLFNYHIQKLPWDLDL